MASRPARVFISYSSKDKDLLLELVEHLAALREQGRIQLWYDTRGIDPGEKWDHRVKAELEAADVIVLLVSASFMHSPYIQDVELQRAFERHDEGTAVLVPVLVREVHLDGTRLAQLQLLPANREPVASFPGRHDEAWTQVVAGVDRRLQQARGATSSQRPWLSARASATPDEWRHFAKVLASQLQLIDQEHDWSSHMYSDLAAEVEAEDGPSGRRRQLVREPSLQAALEKSSSQLVLVEGEPGSGKSVSLRQLTGALLARAVNSATDFPVLPLYVNLNELELGELRSARSSELAAYVRARGAAGHAEAKRFLDDHFDQAMAQGRWLILLDSFDEIPAVLSSAQPDDAVARHAGAIHEFAHNFHRCRVVVSSRPYRGPGRMPWPRFRILPLGEERRKNIVKSWFPDQKLAARVLAELVESPGLGDWVDNPLLLSLICAHREASGVLPSSAYEAFESLVERRVRKHPEVLQRLGMDRNLLREGSELIAFCMTADPDTGLMPSREAIRILLRQLVGQATDVTDGVLDGLIELKLGRGSITAGDRAGFGFFHRRLQEYFATCHVLKGSSRVHLRDLLTDERWRETAVTLLQIARPEQVAPLLREARAALAECAADIARAGAMVDAQELWAQHDLASFDAKIALESKRREAIPVEFPWGASLPLLRILGSQPPRANLADPALAQATAALQRVADHILISVVVRGLRFDHSWAIEAMGVASANTRAMLLSWAFQSESQWLEESAFRQAAHLDEIPRAVDAGIRRALLARESSGKLHAEPTRLLTQLGRLRRHDKYRDIVRLLRMVAVFDVLAYAALIFLMLGATMLHGGYIMFLVASFGLLLSKSFAGKTSETGPRALVATASMLLRGCFACGVVLLLLFPLPVRIALLPVAYLAVSLRPGAYLSIDADFSVRATSWPLLGLSPLRLLRRAKLPRSIRSWQVPRLEWPEHLVVVILLSLSLIAAANVYFVNSWLLVLCGVVALTGVIAWVWLDKYPAHRLRSSAAQVDANQLLHDLAGLLNPDSRTAHLRWVREQGKLAPTPGGESLLRELVLAIERDRHQLKPLSYSKRHAASDQSWSKDLRIWYDDHADRRHGLLAWHGETLDEICRLLEQIQQRVRDRF